MKDYYKILELAFGSDISGVKKSYRQLALKYHPDKNQSPDASAKFIELTEAYEVLNNEVKKSQYDKLYSKYFVKNEQNEWDEIIKTQEWADYGRKKSEEYASMKYDDFADRIIDELKLGVSYTPNVIFILICLGGVASAFYLMVNVSEIFGLIVLVVYGTLCYFLYDRARKDYIAERRHKILNKYK